MKRTTCFPVTPRLVEFDIACHYIDDVESRLDFFGWSLHKSIQNSQYQQTLAQNPIVVTTISLRTKMKEVSKEKVLLLYRSTIFWR